MLPILMPLADGHEIHSSVLRGILQQTIDTILIPLSTPRAKNKRISEGISRFRLINQALARNEQYFAMIDNDQALTSIYTLEKALELSQSLNAMVHVHKNGRFNDVGSHMDIGCIVFPCSALASLAKAFNTDIDEPPVCWCSAVTSKITMPQVWLPNIVIHEYRG